MANSLSTVQGYFDPNAYHICLLTTGQGTHHLSANNNAFYVGIDSNNNIQVEAETEFDNVSGSYSDIKWLVTIST